jgi:hypothetical protein
LKNVVHALGVPLHPLLEVVRQKMEISSVDRQSRAMMMRRTDEKGLFQSEVATTSNLEKEKEIDDMAQIQERQLSEIVDSWWMPRDKAPRT